MSPINLVNGAFHLNIMHKVELDWPGLVRTGLFQMGEAALKGCLRRHTLCLTGLITVRYGSLLRSGVSTQ